jgi:hypothetical protein
LFTCAGKNEVWHWCCGSHLLDVSIHYSFDKEEIKERKTTTTQMQWISTQFLHQGMHCGLYRVESPNLRFLDLRFFWILNPSFVVEAETPNM